jgi:hypothetical protein
MIIRFLISDSSNHEYLPKIHETCPEKRLATTQALRPIYQLDAANWR